MSSFRTLRSFSFKAFLTIWLTACFAAHLTTNLCLAQTRDPGSVAFETTALLSGALMQYQTYGTKAPPSKLNAIPTNLTQYMTHLRIDTKKQFAATKGHPLQKCSPALPCLVFINGGVLQYDITQHLTPTTAFYWNIDPDEDGPEGRFTFYQYPNGKITPALKKLPGTKVTSAKLESDNSTPGYVADLLKH